MLILLSSLVAFIETVFILFPTVSLTLKKNDISMINEIYKPPPCKRFRYCSAMLLFPWNLDDWS